jgi:hypothetical protein
MNSRVTSPGIGLAKGDFGSQCQIQPPVEHVHSAGKTRVAGNSAGLFSPGCEATSGHPLKWRLGSFQKFPLTAGDGQLRTTVDRGRLAAPQEAGRLPRKGLRCPRYKPLMRNAKRALMSKPLRPKGIGAANNLPRVFVMLVPIRAGDCPPRCYPSGCSSRGNSL